MPINSMYIVRGRMAAIDPKATRLQFPGSHVMSTPVFFAPLSLFNPFFH